MWQGVILFHRLVTAKTTLSQTKTLAVYPGAKRFKLNMREKPWENSQRVELNCTENVSSKRGEEQFPDTGNLASMMSRPRYSPKSSRL